MSEDEEPDPSDEVREGSEHLAGQVGPLMRQMGPYLQAQEAWRRQMEPMLQAHERWRRQFEPMLQAYERMRRQMEPILRAHEAYRRQAEQIFRGNEALRRQAEQIAQATEQLARCASSPKIGMGLGLLRLAGVMDTSMRELLSPGSAATAEVAAAGGLAPSPTVFVSSGDVATASEGESVDERDSRRRALAGLSGGQILALVLVWLIAYGLPIYLYSQSPTPSTLIEGNLATVALAYDITCRILDKRK